MDLESASNVALAANEKVLVGLAVVVEWDHRIASLEGRLGKLEIRLMTASYNSAVEEPGTASTWWPGVRPSVGPSTICSGCGTPSRRANYLVPSCVVRSRR